MKPGHVAFLTVGLALATACSDEEPPPVPVEQPPAITGVFNCEASNGPLTFTVRTMGEKLALWLPMDFDRPYLALEQVRAASGARYEANDVMVWLHGSEAMLQVDGETFKSCSRDTYASVWEHAKLSGVDFRATGNEPGWILEIRDRQSLLLNYDYGESVIEAQLSGPVEDAARQQAMYSATVNGQAVSIRISARHCTDSMSGFEFESTVVVEIGERALRGCGRALH